ncbi:MAG: GC-type dockerin domain-anchored protein, partial [Planctomycetota bacterium]|nr:GC-type dockerin domain-anchored protein [Planctomycetota bacterium]
RVIALEATGAPGLPGFAPFEAFGEVALPALADDGRIFFEARVGGAGNGDSALFTHWNGLLTFIAAPMRTTVDGLLVTGGFEALSMGDDGRIAFVCTLLSPFGELRAIVTGAPDDLGLYDDLQIAALDGQGVMDDGMQIEIDLDDVNGDAAGRMRMNAAGVIAMRVRWREPGGMESLGDAMLRWRDGALAIAARSGDALEDGSGAVISAIGEATLGSSAQILFDVETQSARGASGTAVVVAFEGTTAVQLRSGDVLEDLDGVLRQAAEVRVPVGANPAVEDGDVMSEQGRFPVRVRFTDGAEAVYVVLPQSGCPSDINGDGIVNAGDLATLLNDWGSSFPQSDISGDGVVNAADLASLLNDWGVCK